jgi:hypothetical protein
MTLMATPLEAHWPKRGLIGSTAHSACFKANRLTCKAKNESACAQESPADLRDGSSSANSATAERR